MKLSREKIEERIPFCFGVLQRIADDLNVSHTAVLQFLNKPENADLKEIIKDEKKRLKEYAEMTVFRHLISGDIETAKWYLETFKKNPGEKKSRGRKRSRQNEFILLNETSTQKDYRELSFAMLDFSHASLPHAVTKYLPENLKKQVKMLEGKKEDEGEGEGKERKR